MASKDRKWNAMNPELSKLLKKVKVWKTFLIRKIKFHKKELLGQVFQTQTQLYEQAHLWVAGHAPVVTANYDKTPPWFKRGIFYLPWFCAFIIILNYFNVFDRSPTIKSVQDPNVVVVNEDLHKMIADGKAQVSPFVEELRASGRIDSAPIAAPAPTFAFS